MSDETSETGALLPRDLDDWVIVRTSVGERFLGRPVDRSDPSTITRLKPAYELLQQVNVRDGRVGPPGRLVVPLEFQDARQTVDVVASAITYLREASPSERRMWLQLIHNAESLRKQIALANNGFVSASQMPNGPMPT